MKRTRMKRKGNATDGRGKGVGQRGCPILPVTTEEVVKRVEVGLRHPREEWGGKKGIEETLASPEI